MKFHSVPYIKDYINDTLFRVFFQAFFAFFINFLLVGFKYSNAGKQNTKNGKHRAYAPILSAFYHISIYLKISVSVPMCFCILRKRELHHYLVVLAHCLGKAEALIQAHRRRVSVNVAKRYPVVFSVGFQHVRNYPNCGFAVAAPLITLVNKELT